jgi:hypothetical protein
MPHALPKDLAIEGHAIVSADGMIADAEGGMPTGLRNDADWRRFQAALDRAALVVLGRLGHERHPNPNGRRRLVVTSGVAALAADAADPRTSLWNPGGMTLDRVLEELGIATGTVAVTGGTRVFDLFLPWFDSFALATATRVRMPGGRPCFSTGVPETVLAGAGLVASGPKSLDADAGVMLVEWTRPGTGKST